MTTGHSVVLRRNDTICRRALRWTRGLLAMVLMATVGSAVTGCSTVPMTGRRQLKIFPEAQMATMARDQYQQVLTESKVISGTPQSEMVARAGQRIAAATDEYVRREGLGMQFEWSVVLIDDAQVNAWCMPGGKIAFYTGILPYCQDETGVAVVMGHEVAHALAGHGNERFSQAVLAQFGMVALDTALSQKPEQTRQMWMTSVGIGSQLGMLHYSRSHELEADEMGLVLMAMAGYDPRQAVDFWQRMSASGGAKPPEFLSTHPSDDRRIAQIRSLLPKAMPHYEAAAKAPGPPGGTP